MATRATVAKLHRRGFDLTSATPFVRAVKVRCSQCEALVICGIPAHETGCPNAMRECGGCNELLPVRHRSPYCEDCL